VKLFCYALVFACLLIPVGTSARTGLLCIGLLAVLMLRETRRRFVYLAALALAAVVAVPFLPASFTERMATIDSYQADASASTRIQVWKWTLDYVEKNPFGGGFNAYLQNHIRYDTVEVVDHGAQATVDKTLQVDAARAYHSSYFEMLGEQGWPGLILWLAINFGGVLRMEVLRRRYRRSTAPDEAWIAPLAGALQGAHLIYLLGSVFVGIAFQPFVYELVGAQIGLDTYLGRRRREQAWRPIRPRRAIAQAPAGFAG
jgi:O-antigen ligase